MSEGQSNKLKLMLGFVPQPNLQLFGFIVKKSLISFILILMVRCHKGQRTLI
jgi:hypothetical protein